eukprot:jgi/Mesen1/5662/ME000286S04869
MGETTGTTSEQEATKFDVLQLQKPADKVPEAASAPKDAQEAVFKASEQLPSSTPIIRGYDFSKGVDHAALLQSLAVTGFQASNLGQAITEVNRMVDWRLSDEPIVGDEAPEHLDPAVRAATKCKIFLGFTSNLVSSGLRETIRFLVQHRL